jgi:hypothetical protein
MHREIAPASKSRPLDQVRREGWREFQAALFPEPFGCFADSLEVGAVFDQRTPKARVAAFISILFPCGTTIVTGTP